MKVKAGVKFHKDTWKYPEVVRIIRIVEDSAPPQYEPTITSGCDGEHVKESKHYYGKALDFRVRDLQEAPRERWKGKIERRLGNDYYVKLSSVSLHIQWNG